jgi:hypothetical protein
MRGMIEVIVMSLKLAAVSRQYARHRYTTCGKRGRETCATEVGCLACCGESNNPGISRDLALTREPC